MKDTRPRFKAKARRSKRNPLIVYTELIVDIPHIPLGTGPGPTEEPDARLRDLWPADQQPGADDLFDMLEHKHRQPAQADDDERDYLGFTAGQMFIARTNDEAATIVDIKASKKASAFRIYAQELGQWSADVLFGVRDWNSVAGPGEHGIARVTAQLNDPDADELGLYWYRPNDHLENMLVDELSRSHGPRLAIGKDFKG